MLGRLPLRNTMALCFDCWTSAESQTCREWAGSSPNAGEEFITERLWQLLSENLRAATKCGTLSRAFERDLVRAVPRLASNSMLLHKLSHRLFMDCQLHNRQKEAETGADFGLLLNRPIIEHCSSTLRLPMKESGILCQAKLRSKR